MIHVYGFDEVVLDVLCPDHAQSPEEFLIYLEEALESGELTIDEVSEIIADYNRR